MTKVVDKIVATTEQGEQDYPISVLAENVIMDAATGLTLKDFYNYVKNYFDEGDFMMFGSSEAKRTLQNKPQSRVKFFYDEG